MAASAGLHPLRHSTRRDHAFRPVLSSSLAMSRVVYTALPLLLGASLGVGCRAEAPPAPPPVELPERAKLHVPPAPAPPASRSGQSNPGCVAPYTSDGTPESFSTTGYTGVRTGGLIDFQSVSATDETMVFGVIANLKSASAENRFNLERYFEFFASEQAQALLVAGDLGDGDHTTESMVVLLDVLARSGLPVLVIPGSRESLVGYSKALSAIGTLHPNVIDMTQVRLVRFPHASVISLPGYYDARYLAAGEAGCQYHSEDVAALAGIVEDARRPAVLLSHAEFLGRGPEALDAFHEGNAGDKNLLTFLKTHPVPFGVVANIHEAGGRGTDLGSVPVREGVPQKTLFINPGPADSTPWKLNDGTWSNGMVASLRIVADEASYRTFRLPALTDDEREDARRRPLRPERAE